MDFLRVETPNIHIQRKTEMLQKFPQIKELIGPYFPTFFWILGINLVQFILAFNLLDKPFWWSLLVAYFIGSFMNHAQTVLIHECCHNLVFKKTWMNKVMGIICDFCLIMPSALGFRKYHMIHHRHLNEYEMDPDVVSYKEGRWVKNSRWKKTFWLIFFMFSQALRPIKLKNVHLWNKWIVANLVVQISLNMAILHFWGWKALLYLTLSTFFGLGLHPCGGRWIHEHYVTKEGQETYSYYGPLNYFCFNMGYHNEHHDFMNIPWIHLPKLRYIAPEYYNDLKSYQSWVYVLWNFITNKQMHPFKRIIHPSTQVEKQLVDS